MAQARNRQVRAKRQTADSGEAFTAEREVNVTFDWVNQETGGVSSSFGKLVCENGNFLVAIQKRKLVVVDISKKSLVYRSIN